MYACRDTIHQISERHHKRSPGQSISTPFVFTRSPQRTQLCFSAPTAPKHNFSPVFPCAQQTGVCSRRSPILPAPKPTPLRLETVFAQKKEETTSTTRQLVNQIRLRACLGEGNAVNSNQTTTSQRPHHKQAFLDSSRKTAPSYQAPGHPSP